jgi:hypothetical protein
MLSAVVTAGALVAAQGPVVNARVERRPAAQGVAREIQSVVARGAAAWVGYSVPLLRRTDGRLGVSDWWGGRCRLEPPTELVVLARAEGGSLVDIRSLAVDCDVNANGMPLVWFEGVSADDSVAWLSSLTPASLPAPPGDRLARAALASLAQHASPAAARPLVQLARSATTPQLRSRAIGLLAVRPAAEALPTLSEAVDDADRQVRRQAIAALGRLGGGAGVPRLMDLARTHKDQEVRRQAMQSLGASRDPRAMEFFAAILK